MSSKSVELKVQLPMGWPATCSATHPEPGLTGGTCTCTQRVLVRQHDAGRGAHPISHTLSYHTNNTSAAPSGTHPEPGVDGVVAQVVHQHDACRGAHRKEGSGGGCMHAGDRHELHLACLDLCTGCNPGFHNLRFQSHYSDEASRAGCMHAGGRPDLRLASIGLCEEGFSSFRFQSKSQ